MHTNLSRRNADEYITQSRVTLNGKPASLGATVQDGDKVGLDGKTITAHFERLLVMLNKPEGYVCSKAGQGSKTIYELLPAEYKELKPIGRLDKDSSGLLLLTNDGDLMHELMHPSKNHTKTYIVVIDKPLDHQSEILLTDGVDIGDDRPSKMGLKLLDTERTMWEVTLSEGRNRQIRRSFAAAEREVVSLHRTSFASYTLNDLASGNTQQIVVK